MPTSVNIMITGVSSGIGHGLAQVWLERGASVYGCSRRTPEDLVADSNFHFQPLDLCEPDDVQPAFAALLQGVAQLDLVVLNAGRLGRFSDLAEADLNDLQQTMLLNVWSNKLVLDALAQQKVTYSQVVAMSSGAAVNGNRGWSGYSVSKAALNMLVRLYSRELPDVHFTALAPGVVDTEIQSELRSVPPDARFPALDKMRALHGTDAMPDPRRAAESLVEIFTRLPELVESGAFADIRQLPTAEAAS